MPIIRIDNAPKSWTKMKLVELATALRQACFDANMPGIERVEQITVMAGSTRLLTDDHIVIVVEELFRRENRPLKVRQKLARALMVASMKLCHGSSVTVRIIPWNLEEDPYLVAKPNGTWKFLT